MQAGIDTTEMASKANRLAEEQAALRRVATLVASSARPKQVFQVVAEEAVRLLEARTAATVRFDHETAVVVGSWNDGAKVSASRWAPSSPRRLEGTA